MTVKQAFAPQTCTTREQVAKAASSPRKAGLPMTQFPPTGKVRASRRGRRPQGQSRSRMNSKKGALSCQWVQALLNNTLLCRTEVLTTLAQQDSIFEMDHWPFTGPPIFPFCKGNMSCGYLVLWSSIVNLLVGKRKDFFFFFFLFLFT